MSNVTISHVYYGVLNCFPCVKTRTSTHEFFYQISRLAFKSWMDNWSKVNRPSFSLKPCLIFQERVWFLIINTVYQLLTSTSSGTPVKFWEPWCVFCCVIIDDHNDDFFEFSWIRNQSFRRKNGSNWGKNEKDEWLLDSRQDKQRLIRQTLWRPDCRDA